MRLRLGLTLTLTRFLARFPQKGGKVGKGEIVLNGGLGWGKP